MPKRKKDTDDEYNRARLSSLNKELGETIDGKFFCLETSWGFSNYQDIVDLIEIINYVMKLQSGANYSDEYYQKLLQRYEKYPTVAFIPYLLAILIWYRTPQQQAQKSETHTATYYAIKAEELGCINAIFFLAEVLGNNYFSDAYGHFKQGYERLCGDEKLPDNVKDFAEQYQLKNIDMARISALFKRNIIYLLKKFTLNELLKDYYVLATKIGTNTHGVMRLLALFTKEELKPLVTSSQIEFPMKIWYLTSPASHDRWQELEANNPTNDELKQAILVSSIEALKGEKAPVCELK